jgi:magnesium transporter
MIQLSEKFGVPPGTVLYVGREADQSVRISLIEFNEKEVHDAVFSDFSECITSSHPGLVRWINVDGVHNTKLIEEICNHFRIHPLTQEDIVNTNQRAKYEDYDNYAVCIMKMIYTIAIESDKSTDARFIAEQLTIILLNNNTVLSFQEAESGDVFDVIRTRIRQGKGRVRKCAADYLCYALIDAVIDSYFSILEEIGDQVEELDEEMTQDPKPHTLHMLYKLKRRMIYIRKAVWPMREMLSLMERTETNLIGQTTYIYLRDAHDHAIRVIDTVETYRDLLGGMMDLYMSSVSNKMNEIMKTLTIITTIFVPLTFLTGVYGMNFDILPGKTNPMGFWELCAIMLILVIGLLYYFRRRKWL